MNKSRFTTFRHSLAIIIAISSISAAVPAFGSAAEVRDAYEKYLKSYTDFKKAAEDGTDNDALKNYAEKYKLDLDNYKKLLEPGRVEKPEYSSDNVKSEKAPGDGAASSAANPSTTAKTVDSRLGKALIMLHNGGAARLDEAIGELEKIAAAAGETDEAGRAKFELGRAYIEKKDYAKAETILTQVAKDPGNKMSGDASKVLEIVKYQKNMASYSAAARAARALALEKSRNYESVSWKNPASKIAAKFSQTAAALKYRWNMANMKDYDGGGNKSAFGVAKTFVTDLFKNGTKIDLANKKENDLIANDAVWKSRQRYAFLVEENGGLYRLTNVRWGFSNAESGDEDKIIPRWRTVTLDANAVREAYMVIKPFAPEWIAGHCFFLFEFDEAHPVVTEYGEKSYGFIMSMEAHQKVGQSYSFTGNFGVVYLLLSKEDYVQICAVNGSRLIPYKLKLTDEQKKGLLVTSIREAVKERGMEQYKLFENNCTNILFGMLNSVLPKDRQFREWVIKDVLNNKLLAIPKLAPKFLKKHDLIAEVMPTILPDKKNAAPAEGKPLDGSQLAAAKDRLSNLESRAAEVKTAVISAIDSGSLDKNGVMKLFYDDRTDMVEALNIPGPIPDAVSAGAFSIDENDFTARMKSIDTRAALSSYISSLFDSYAKALRERMLMDGPDIYQYLMDELDAVEKQVK